MPEEQGTTGDAENVLLMVLVSSREDKMVSAT